MTRSALSAAAWKRHCPSTAPRATGWTSSIMLAHVRSGSFALPTRVCLRVFTWDHVAVLPAATVTCQPLLGSGRHAVTPRQSPSMSLFVVISQLRRHRRSLCGSCRTVLPREVWSNGVLTVHRYATRSNRRPVAQQKLTAHGCDSAPTSCDLTAGSWIVCFAVMSSNDDTSTMQRFLTNGASDYLVKPVNKGQLAALRRLMVAPAAPAAAPVAATACAAPLVDPGAHLRRSSRIAPAVPVLNASPVPADVQQTSCSEDSHRTISQTAVPDTAATVLSVLDDGSSPAELLRACMAKATQAGVKRPRLESTELTQRAVRSSAERASSASAPSKQAVVPAQPARAAPAAAPLGSVRFEYKTFVVSRLHFAPDRR